jgi:hypothetical protein
MNQFETRSERILPRDEVLDMIRRRAEGCTVLDERKDAVGIYYLEAKTSESTPGSYTVYIYQRAGTFPEQAASATTLLEAVHYSDGMPIGGDTISELDPVSGEWRDK